MIDPLRDWVRGEFDRLAPVLQRAIDRTDGLYELEHVWEEIDLGGAQFWPGPNSVVVTKIETYPTGVKTITGWLAAGDFEEVQGIRKTIKEWARGQGCTRFYIVGRRGWLRSLDGFQEKQTIMYEEI